MPEVSTVWLEMVLETTTQLMAENRFFRAFNTHPKKRRELFLRCYLKGQSHEKVGELGVQGDSLGPN
jgi:DNA-directed RNA polymerase specialized sigma24 family protein